MVLMTLMANTFGTSNRTGLHTIGKESRAQTRATSTRTTTTTSSSSSSSSSIPKVLPLIVAAVILVTVATVAVAGTADPSWLFRPADYPPIPKQPIRIFGPTPIINAYGFSNTLTSASAAAGGSSSSSLADRTLLESSKVHHQLFSPDDQWAFLQSSRGQACWPNVKERYKALSQPFQLELFKYCFIVLGYGNVYQDEGISWLIDPLEALKPSQSLVIQPPIIIQQQPQQTTQQHSNNDNDARETSNNNNNNFYYHSSFLQLHKKNVARRMVQFIMETPRKTLESSPLLLPAKLHQLMQPIRKVEYQSICRTLSSTQSCPLPGGLCCQVTDGDDIVATLRNPILSPRFHATQTSSQPGISTTSSTFSYPKNINPLFSTITVHPTGNKPATPMETPNFFDILLQNDCFPTSKSCYKCLKRPSSSCIECAEDCGCYCKKALCQIRPPPKVVTQIWHVHPPQRQEQSSTTSSSSSSSSHQRLIPRLIHQTWFEPVTPDKYPNMSRLIESWKLSGWDYTFYDDESAADFLSLHFPPQVRQAYDTILPGAFKADLFRYCVLLIKGGVYADMDVLLESNLDAVIEKDVGFMVPMDEPGSATGHQSCLWNGLLAVAPGHIFLARTIEHVVNNIRNRFTSVDYDDFLCPNPILSVSHTVDTLFTCGPCILGAAMNQVLGRHMQTEWEVGEVDVWNRKSKKEEGGGSSGGTGEGKSYQELSHDEYGQVLLPDDDDNDGTATDPRLAIFGRTIILAQNKNDMGAHRFTWQSRHIMVAATDMPDYDDRPPTKQHYSRTHEKTGVYGLRNLYKDNVKANERIRIVVRLD